MKTEHEVSYAKIQRLITYTKSDMQSSRQSGIKLKEKARKLKISIISISSLVTVTLGLNISSDAVFFEIQIGEIIKGSAIILSATLTALNTWDVFVNYHTRSIQEATIVTKLSHLYKDINLYLEGNTDCKLCDYELFKEQYSIIHDEYAQDRNSISEKDSGKNKDDANKS